MQSNKKYNHSISQSITPYVSNVPCIALIAGADTHGDILVTVDNSPPIVARLVAGLNRSELASKACLQREVLVIFEKGDPARPIIMALMADPVKDLLSMVVDSDSEEKSQDINLDGKRVRIEAEDEVEIRCGPGSILLRNDGKIVLKGIRIVSRAREVNKIKGGAVRIN
ncbi:MAG: hypothetical protein HQK65_00335 [Desulfamplus sp.]|nr:hypothetical protein [Desulfamplus sp.]